MATIDSLAPESEAHDSHGHDHDHPEWLAHHFDTPEQQFDSGKLGIWLFLVTEVLFFSGMFCAYAIFRMLRPEVFEGCSQFLNTKLGAINTGVLLFSSLTMAWAVRCAQTEEHKKLVVLLASTLSCAMVFLGVKSIEYSHKWGMGLLPPGSYFYDAANPHPTQQQMVEQHGFTEGTAYFLHNSLYFLCAPFLLLTIGVAIWGALAFVQNKKFQFECAKPLFVVCLSFFLGVGMGLFLESGGSEGHGSEHAVAHASGEHGHGAEGHGHQDAGDHAANTDNVSIELLAAQEGNTGAKDMLLAEQAQADEAVGQILAPGVEADMGVAHVEKNVQTKRQAGVFFGIYYCMTGVHAIHILAGIGVLVWLLIRAIRQDFNKHYFGPVDYVGLYWHIVDMIWIYLFPLLYLIR